MSATLGYAQPARDRIYATVKEAHNALCLDMGFDPFLHGLVVVSGRKFRRPTKTALAALGYQVVRHTGATQ